MRQFLKTVSGRMMLASMAFTLAASAIHILFHSTAALALFVLPGIAIGVIATANAMADKDLAGAMGCILLQPVFMFLAAIGIGVGVEEWHWVGYLFAIIAAISLAFAIVPSPRPSSPTPS